MQLKQNSLASLLKVGLCAVLALGAIAVQADDKKVDPSGTYTWSQPGRNGGPDRVSTLKLKVAGDKVTGTVTAPGRGGNAGTDTEISDGKLVGDEISFSVTREFNGNSMTAKYSGKVTADSIKGKVETERNGTPQSRDWEATRGAARAAAPAPAPAPAKAPEKE
jgi:hypothetical protein